MAIASVIVETAAGEAEAVAACLACQPHVTVIEAETSAALFATVEQLRAVDRVVGVFPVYLTIQE